MLKKVYNRLKMTFLRNRFHSCGKITLLPGYSISGYKSIRIGGKFFANRYLRVEVFGTENSVKLVIGDGVAMGENVHIAVAKGIEIQDNVLMGSRILITDHNHGSYSGPDQSSPETPPGVRDLVCREVVIGKNVWIGDGVVILPGSSIGSGSIIGANSVVNGEIPENVIAVGSPCKLVKMYNIQSRVWEKKREA